MGPDFFERSDLTSEVYKSAASSEFMHVHWTSHRPLPRDQQDVASSDHNLIVTMKVESGGDSDLAK